MALITSSVHPFSRENISAPIYIYIFPSFSFSSRLASSSVLDDTIIDRRVKFSLVTRRIVSSIRMTTPFRGCCTAGRARVPRILKSQSAFWRKSCLFLCSPLITGEGGGRTKLARNKGTREIVSLSSLVVLVLSRKVNAILSNIYLRNSTKEIYVF